MLTQLRLFSRPYIPIRPVVVLPREIIRQERLIASEKRKAQREREQALKALHLPLIKAEHLRIVEDRSDVEAAMALQPGPDAVGVGPEIDQSEQEVVWTIDEMLVMHSVLLEESLRALAAKGNPSEKMEILEWIFESDYFAEVVLQSPNGPRKTVIYNSEVALSFAMCCRLEGHDPAFWRAFLRRTIPDVVARFICHDDEDAPCLQQALMPHRSPY